MSTRLAGDLQVSSLISRICFGISSALFFCLLPSYAHAQTVGLTYRPVTAEYSNSLDRIVMISASPNQLHIFNPVDNTDTTVNLPKAPLCLSVSLDGKHAAVGHDALVSYVNLSTAALEKTLPVTTTVNHLVLGNDWVYILTYSSGTIAIQISTGVAPSTGFGVYSGSQGRLHPGGTALYTTDDGISPEHLKDTDVSTGPPTSSSEGPYHGDYAVCGGVWFSPDGRRVYTGCGTAYQANPQNPSNYGARSTKSDGMYWGTLTNSFQVGSLTESASLGRIAATPTIPSYSTTTVKDNQVFLYDSAWLEPAGVFQLPDFAAGAKSYQAHARQVFFNQASTSLYVVMQADGSSGLLNDFAVQVFPVGNPQACAPAFGTAAVTLPASGTVASVDIKAPATCIYQATTNADWIQILSGGYGSGNGTLNFIARPNPGVARSGTIALGSQTYTISQTAVSVPANALTPLSYSVTVAGYSKSLDRLVLVSASPKELHIYDPVSGSDRIVALPRTPLFLSVGPDGHYAAVGMDGWVSVVDLVSASIYTTIQAFTDAHSVLLGGHDYVYAYPRSTWGELFSFEISTGAMVTQNAIYNGRYPQLYADGNTFYTEGSKWDISKGPAAILSSNFSGSSCSPFWLTEDGARLFDSCGKVYVTSPVPAQDLQYNGSLSNATNVQWAAQSAKLHSTAVIPGVGYSGKNTDDTFLQVYGDAYLGYAGSLALPGFLAGSASYAGHGRNVFWNNAADKLIVVEQADDSAKLVADAGVTVLSLTTPSSGCAFTLGASSASFAKTAGLNTVAVTTGAGCVWEATSNAPWITVNSGALGFGSNTVEYGVSTNSGAVRTGTLTIAGQTFTITQAGGFAGLILTHTGSLSQAQTGAVYTITLTNLSASSVNGAMAITAILPSGLSLVSMQGSGWNCSGTTCSRSDTLAAGAAYPVITLTVNVAGDAPGQLVNQVNLSFNGAAEASASDPTTVLAAFTDVNPADLLLPAINLLRQFGITTGCGNAPPLYCPAANVTRGQMAVFVVRAIRGGDSFPYTAEPYFSDVPAAHPFFKWIQAMRDLGITSGCGASTYCPESPVSRGEMAVFIIRARYGAAASFTFPATPGFTDVPAANGFFPWIQKMQQLGITSGCGASTYCPNDPVTRGQMAAFLMRGGFNQLLPASTPLLLSVTPAAASRGQTVVVTLTGVNTNFAAGVSQVTAGPGVTVANVAVSSATTMTAQLTIAAAARPVLAPSPSARGRRTPPCPTDGPCSELTRPTPSIDSSAEPSAGCYRSGSTTTRKAAPALHSRDTGR